MKLKKSISLSIFILAFIEISLQQYGSCKEGNCGYCEKSGTSSYCTICYDSKMEGEGTDRNCSLDADIGCLTYQSIDNLATGKPYCSACKFGYSLKENTDKTKNTCIKCDRSLNYFTNDGECKLASPVNHCAQYKPSVDRCEICGGGYDLDAINNKCTKLGANCLTMLIGTQTEECTSCEPTHFYRDEKCTTALPLRCSKVDPKDFLCSACQDRSYFKTALKQCSPITALNCLKSPDDKPTECTKCASGYYLDGTTCSLISVSHCDEASSATICTKCVTLISGDGYLLKSDGSKCSDSNGCMIESNYYLYTGTKPQCSQCDISRGYYATGVTGTSTFDLNGKSYWAQVCTKGGFLLRSIALVLIATGFLV